MSRKWPGRGPATALPAVLLPVVVLLTLLPPATDPGTVRRWRSLSSETARSWTAIGNAAPARSALPSPVGGYRWPLDGVPRVVRRFDPPPQPWAAGHRGVDLAAPAGATVRAAGPGVVFFAGMVAGRPVVSVSHGNGLRTTYEPVRSRMAAGEAVRAGDPLGVLLSGHPGCAASGSACLHWGLRCGDDYLDPLLLLGLGRVRLLPVTSGRPVGATPRRRRPG
ncbi:murein hydrolase activator EnvC family protein [Plantactinospora sp. WMMC1484]|uniref:murein hydrolase activator EnvC family protein n=1 Tax=Plantactinospora sp. WMMC1484 TaxID=3404122 RepID=UPI003BF4E3D7